MIACEYVWHTFGDSLWKSSCSFQWKSLENLLEISFCNSKWNSLREGCQKIICKPFSKGGGGCRPQSLHFYKVCKQWEEDSKWVFLTQECDILRSYILNYYFLAPTSQGQQAFICLCIPRWLDRLGITQSQTLSENLFGTFNENRVKTSQYPQKLTRKAPMSPFSVNQTLGRFSL